MLYLNSARFTWDPSLNPKDLAVCGVRPLAFCTLIMAFALNSPNFAESFSAAGFDDVVIAEGELITARKDDGRAWEVVLDRGGQLKATITFRGTKPKESSIKINGQNASMMTEMRTVMTVFCNVSTASQLPAVLAAIEEAVVKAKR